MLRSTARDGDTLHKSTQYDFQCMPIVPADCTKTDITPPNRIQVSFRHKTRKVRWKAEPSYIPLKWSKQEAEQGVVNLIPEKLLTLTAVGETCSCLLCVFSSIGG